VGEPIIDVERGPGYRFYKVVFDYQPPEISITPRDGFAAPNPPNLQAGMIFQVLGEMDDGAIVLGGYYEGNWRATRRSVDTPGRGVVRDPLDILRAEFFSA
jgi:hypothetical protein